MNRQAAPAPAPDRPLALVTGASRGIGRGLAEELARHGHDLVVVADDDLHDVATELRGHGVEVTAVRADLADAVGVVSVVDALGDLGRPVDVAALNAGVAVGGRFADIALEDDLRLVDVNCRSTVHLAKHVVAGMEVAGRGRLMITASIAAAAPTPYQATYAASKAFLHSLAEALRHELRDSGITVTSLMPGPTDTGIFEGGDLATSLVARGPKSAPRLVARRACAALLAGRDHVVTGPVLNRLTVALSGVVPDRLLAAVASIASVPRSARGASRR